MRETDDEDSMMYSDYEASERVVKKQFDAFPMGHQGASWKDRAFG